MDDHHEIHETHEINLIWFRPQAGLGSSVVQIFFVGGSAWGRDESLWSHNKTKRMNHRDTEGTEKMAAIALSHCLHRNGAGGGRFLGGGLLCFQSWLP